MLHIVIGTKAQLVKMAPVMVRLRQRGLPFRFIFTGQHQRTIDEMLDEFGIQPPDIVLYRGPDIVSVPKMVLWAARILLGSLRDRRRAFAGDRRGVVLVHGDTFSTLLGALMGRLAGLRVAHVESGLRSFRLFHPFPEELTRLLTFRLSHVLLCPGAWAVENVRGLRREIVDTRSNTLGDTLELALDRPARTDHLPQVPFGLVSLHRYENVFRRDRLESIVAHLLRMAESMRLLFILHLPTEKKLRRFGLYEKLEANDNIELRPRYTYFDFVSLLSATRFVVTDGGSVQEEASYLGLPCLLMRAATERQEGLGQNVVLSDYDERIIDTFTRDHASYRRPRVSHSVSPSEIVIDAVLPDAGLAGPP